MNNEIKLRQRTRGELLDILLEKDLEIVNLKQELERYKNIIDELERWLENNIEYGDDDYYDMKAAGVETALNKLKELKGE